MTINCIDGQSQVMELWGMRSTHSLPLFQGPLWLGMVVPSISQIVIFNHFPYLKPFNCVQRNEIWLVLKLLPTNYSFTSHILRVLKIWHKFLPSRLCSRIHQLHLCREVRTLQRVSFIWHKTIYWWGSSDAGALGNVMYLFIAITPRTTLARSGSTWLGPYLWVK